MSRVDLKYLVHHLSIHQGKSETARRWSDIDGVRYWSHSSSDWTFDLLATSQLEYESPVGRSDIVRLPDSLKDWPI